MIISKPEQQFTVAKTPSPSYWYIAVANCQSTVDVSGTIHLQDLEWNQAPRSYNTEFDYSQ